MIAISNAISIGLNRLGGGAPGPDPDAQAFFERVATAGGTLTTAEQNAVNQLVLDLKANSLWTPMKAIYPMVGASAAACAQNLKSSSFTGAFTSGWTFASTGATPNGVSAYMNTALNPILDLTNNDYHLSHYSRTQNILGTKVDIASVGPAPRMISLTQYYGNLSVKGFVCGDYNTLDIRFNNTDTLGFLVGSRTSQTSAKMFMDGVQNGATQTLSNPNLLPTNNIFIGASGNGAIGQEFSNRQCAFASIGNGLTDTQASNFYTAVQAFQTTLERQV